MRDSVKVQKEMQERNRLLLDSAFELFGEKGIEAVSMQMVADRAGVGVATLFRYYPSKPDLAIAVCVDQWKTFIRKTWGDRSMEAVHRSSAMDRMKWTLDTYIGLYQKERKLLIYNENFNHYVRHENVPSEKLESYWEATSPMTARFHDMYECAKVDKTFRTDIPEYVFRRITLHTMMSACVHYAGDFVWGACREDEDYVEELQHLKQMIIDYIAPEDRSEKEELPE